MFEGQSNFEHCSNMSELFKYERTYREIYERKKRSLASSTGCQFPCKYKKFDIVDAQIKDQPGDFLFTRFASDDIEIETEVYVYDWISFIAECGGAMGLFVGFSFLMLFDVMVDVSSFFIKTIKIP